jgi:hypothetical protein
MIRNNFTSASIEFWRKHQAEKEALSRKNLIQGCFLAVGLFAMPFVILFVLILISGKAHATGLTDLKFGQAQIADSQWNVQACTQTATCQIYSKNPGTAYRIPWTSGQLSWAAGDYVAFATTGNSANPYNAVQYNSAGQQKSVMGTGHIINMGSDYFFFVGNDNNTGQLFSMTQGFANTSGVTWTGTLNPTIAQVNAYAAGGSTTPLSAGQTAAPPPTNNTTAAGTMPGGYIGRVLNNTPATWQTYSFTFTPAQTGANYVMLSFRQDPAYWSVDNISVKAAGSNVNLLRNGGMDTGGTITAQTNNGPTQVSTPTYWGVAYQAGIYPGAAGMWNSAIWYDGAVGSFDAIYQALNLTAGTTYTISFMVAGDNTASTNLNGPVQLGVYAGPCGNLSLAPDQCTLPSTTGYTTLATPSEGASAGNSAPTVTGTSTSNNTTSSSTTTNDFQGTIVTDVTYSNGVISGYDSIVYGTDSQVTTTTVTTPVTTTYWSDGTSTSTNGSSSTSQTVTDTYNVWKVYQIPAWSYTIPVVTGNSIYLNQSGSNPQVTIEQVGQYNAVAGINNPNAYLVGNNNSLVIRQSGSDNLALVKVSGNNNVVQIPQGYYHNWANGAEYPATGSANDIALVSVLGNSNSVFMPQQGYRNLATSTTNGNGNNSTIVQYGNDNKAYNIINGDGNSLGSWQQGNGNLSTISMTGNGNQASVTQTGNNNSSTITLVNAGGPSSVNVTQTNNGSGTGNLLSIQQQCATLNGCSVTINQTK